MQLSLYSEAAGNTGSNIQILFSQKEGIFYLFLPVISQVNLKFRRPGMRGDTRSFRVKRLLWITVKGYYPACSKFMDS
jgi:hypothetical protein